MHQVDPLCQSVIEETILAAFPDHAVLGEESVAPGAAASSDALAAIVNTADYLWVSLACFQLSMCSQRSSSRIRLSI
jgi:fructose-1,6-bisphosphatase/inositol monophosphatase family enzyme